LWGSIGGAHKQVNACKAANIPLGMECQPKLTHAGADAGDWALCAMVAPHLTCIDTT
jgi:hypothetical protein